MMNFQNACAKGNLRVVKLYLAEQGFDMNAGDNYGNTGFHQACRYGHLNVAQFLIQQGFDMNIGDNDGTTGFHQACGYGYLNVVQFLVEKGFDINAGNNNGFTGFHWACVSGKLNVVRFLIQQGFDMNVGSNYENTGFQQACGYGHLNVAKFLVEQGFDINASNNNGTTGLKMLIRRYTSFFKSNSLGAENFSSCALFLIEAGATLNENDVFEDLISAIQNRIIEITFIEQLIFEKWTGRIAQAITDFSMEPYTSTSLQNLTQILDY